MQFNRHFFFQGIFVYSHKEQMQPVGEAQKPEAVEVSS
jgi:hypothetical protein